MSPRYYIISALIVFGVTAAVSYWKQKRGVRAIAIVLVQVTGVFLAILAAMVGFAKLLAVLGVAQSGFFL